MHLGGVLIIAGSMYSSAVGHQIQRKFLHCDKIAKGQMTIYEGHVENRILIDPNTHPDIPIDPNAGLDNIAIYKLPFEVRLNAFHMEYYDAGTLTVWVGDDAIWSGIAAKGRVIKLPGEYGTIIVQETFNRLMIGKGGVAADVEGPGANPAAQVLVKRLDGTEGKHYVFEKYAPVSKEAGFDMSYRRQVSDYISELEVIKNGKVVSKKNIEVNHPLHYGGYHFYQSSYMTPQEGQPWATVLSVTSDSGLYCVFAGFIAVCAGIIYHLWIMPMIKSKRTNSNLAVRDIEDGH